MNHMELELDMSKTKKNKSKILTRCDRPIRMSIYLIIVMSKNL